MELNADSDDQLAPRQAEPGRWIGIETAGLYGSVAAAKVTSEECHIVAAEALPKDARSAQTLAPALSEMLERLGCKAETLAAVAVAAGPGSFTGLRVGVVTAKAFAYASGAAVIGVDTLDALAQSAPAPCEEGAKLWAALDAQRGELFVASFLARHDRWHRDQPTQRLTRQALLDAVGKEDLVVGPMAEALVIGGDCRAANTEPTASAVLQVARREWKAGKADNVFALLPRYHRLSAAEEKLGDPQTPR